MLRSERVYMKSWGIHLQKARVEPYRYGWSLWSYRKTVKSQLPPVCHFMKSWSTLDDIMWTFLWRVPLARSGF